MARHPSADSEALKKCLETTPSEACGGFMTACSTWGSSVRALSIVRSVLLHRLLLVCTVSSCVLWLSAVHSAYKSVPVHLEVQLGHPTYLIATSFSPDGKTIHTAGSDGAMKRWDIETGSILDSYSISQHYVAHLVFSTDGRWALASGNRSDATLYELSSGKTVRSFSPVSHLMESATGKPRRVGISSIAISRDSQWILTGIMEGTVLLWNSATGEMVRSIEAHAKDVLSVAFSPDGQSLLTGGADKSVHLWSTVDGKLLRTFANHTDEVRSLATSLDGTHIATGCRDGSVRIWNAQTGQLLNTLRQHTREIRSIAFSPSGRTILTASLDHTARLWSISDGSLLQTFRPSASSDELLQAEQRDGNVRAVRLDYVRDATISPDGRSVLATSTKGAARLWDLETGVWIRTFEGSTEVMSTVRFSPDGKSLVCAGANNRAHLWNLDDGALSRTLSGPRKGSMDLVSTPQGGVIGEWVWNPEKVAGIRGASFSPDGLTLATGGFDGVIRLWDVSTGQQLHSFPPRSVVSTGVDTGITSVEFSRDGRLLLATHQGVVEVFEIGPNIGRDSITLQGHSSIVNRAVFSGDGSLILSASQDGTAKLWNSGLAFLLRTFNRTSEGLVKKGSIYTRVRNDGPVRAVALSSNGRLAASGGDDGVLTLWDTSTGAVRRELEFVDSGYWSLAFSPDSSTILTGRRDGLAQLIDVATGQETCRLMGHTGQVGSAVFSPDGRFVATTSLDGTSRIWDVAQCRELASLVIFSDNTWAVLDRDGRFDASNGGDVHGLHWVAGSEPISLSQLKSRFYDPGLLSKLTGNSTEPLLEVSRSGAVELFPEVRVADDPVGASTLKLQVTDRGGGIGKVRVRVNGKEIIADARGSKPNPGAATAELAVDLEDAPIVAGRSNTVEIVAWNADGYLSSRGLRLVWTPPGNEVTRHPEVFAIVGGISDYASPALRLRFAAKDARDMATAVALGAKKLFGAEKVHLTLLSTSEHGGAIPPTKANFAKAFAVARKAKPGDILIVYLAGHGVALSGEADSYAYLTAEARTLELTDPAVRVQTAITSEELTEWTKRIPALKQVMVLDTCAAGAAAAKLVEKRAISGSQVRAIERLKDRTGFHVLMGSAADAVSYEATQYGQGILTYALLQGMKGAALRESEFVDVSQLFQYAADQVPQLARNVGGIQKPLIAAPKGVSFDVGQLGEDEKEKIPLAMMRPLVLRPILFNPAANDDDLNLSARLRKALLEDSFAAARGEGSWQEPVFVDSDELPGAIRPTGTYFVQGERVTVKLLLKRNGEKIAEREIHGSKSDLVDLIRRIHGALDDAPKKSATAR